MIPLIPVRSMISMVAMIEIFFYDSLDFCGLHVMCMIPMISMIPLAAARSMIHATPTI